VRHAANLTLACSIKEILNDKSLEYLLHTLLHQESLTLICDGVKISVFNIPLPASKPSSLWLMQ
jgi:hypothetical protein